MSVCIGGYSTHARIRQHVCARMVSHGYRRVRARFRGGRCGKSRVQTGHRSSSSPHAPPPHPTNHHEFENHARHITHLKKEEECEHLCLQKKKSRQLSNVLHVAPRSYRESRTASGEALASVGRVGRVQHTSLPSSRGLSCYRHVLTPAMVS